jgi:hypothetical protein
MTRLNRGYGIAAAVCITVLWVVACDDEDTGSQGGNDTGTDTAEETGQDTTEETGQDTAEDTGGEDTGGEDTGGLDIAVCDPDTGGPFTLEIDNPYFPLAVGTILTLEGDEDGTPIEVIFTVLDETEDVAGVTTRVVEENESEDGELVEISRNFFAQAPDGTVCYFGEDVDDYEDGVIVGHGGAWRAGEDGALPGIQMPATPTLGQTYQQEVAVGIAEDSGEITAVGESVTVEAGTFDDTIEVTESSPLDSGTSLKIYAAGIGMIVDSDVELVEYVLPD